MRVAITGASGYLGTRLAAALAEHEVLRFVRRPATAPDERTWDGSLLGADQLKGVDALVHLSGAGVGNHRWTTRYRAEIRSSRVNTTAAVARAVAQAGTPVFLAGSAIGYYGDRGDEVLDEGSPAGQGFLADVCVAWEAAAKPAATTSRLVHLRTGVVLGHDDALLKKQIPLVKAFLGAPLGSGRQFLSWIAVDDWLAAVRHLLASDVSGPVNLTSPNPVCNADFTKALGSALHRPTWPIKVPGFAVRAAVGGLADEALHGAYVTPAALLADGFAFQHERVESALRAALG